MKVLENVKVSINGVYEDGNNIEREGSATSPIIASYRIKSIIYDLLRESIEESDDMAEIGEIFARKVGEL